MRIASASVFICRSPNISFRSEKTRSQDAELGEMAKTMRAASTVCYKRPHTVCRRVVAPLARTENRQSHVPTRREPTRERYSIHANIDWTTRGPATCTTIPDTTGYSRDTWSKQVQCSGTSAEKACQPAQPVRQSRPAVSESILILLHEDDLQPWQPSAPARSSRQRDQLSNVNACCAVAARHRRTQSAAQ